MFLSVNSAFFSPQVLEGKEENLAINLEHSIISLSQSCTCHIKHIFLKMLLEIPTEFQYSIS